MITVSLSKQVEAWTKELGKFADNIQNNIHIGALRVASNVIKDEIISIDMKTSGKHGIYGKKLSKTDMFVKKRRRTKTGWERFKVSIKHDEDEPQKEGSWHYNIIANSKEKVRFTNGKSVKTFGKSNKFKKASGGQSRGILKRDPFIQRATEKATEKALRGYIYYLKTRILSDGAKLSAKTINNAKMVDFSV